MVALIFILFVTFNSLAPSSLKLSRASSSSNLDFPTVAPYPSAVQGTASTSLDVEVTNPVANTYAIISFSVNAPTGWKFAGVPSCGTDLATLGTSSSSVVQCKSGGSPGLSPGSSTTLELGTLTGPGSTPSNPPVQGTFTTLVTDASGSSSYAGNSFLELDIAPTTIAVSITSGSALYLAGSSPLEITATISSGQIDVPIVWNFSNSLYPTQGYVATLTPASSITASNGSASTTFSPSNHAGDSSGIVATIGESATYATTSSVATAAGPPSQAIFSFTYGATSYDRDYLNNHVSVSGTLYATTQSEVLLSLSDSFGNVVEFSTAIKNVTIGTSSGEMLIDNSFYPAVSCGTASYQIPLADCQNGASIRFPLTTSGGYTVYYVQSSIYGTEGNLIATIELSTGTTFDNVSGSIVTSTFASSLPDPVLNDTEVGAGLSVGVSESLSSPQQGVPVTMYLCTACAETTPGYDSTFLNGQQSITYLTNSSGAFTTSMAVNVTLGDTAVFYTTAADPLPSSPSNILTSADSAEVTTVAGPIASIAINIAANPGPASGQNIASAASRSSVYVDVTYVDAYGHDIPPTFSPSYQTQISLDVNSDALLSATNVYISSQATATNGTSSFGPIILAMPSTTGLFVTLTASAIINNKSVQATYTLLTVSPPPNYSVTITSSTGGSTSPSGTASYKPDSIITLTATPKSGYAFLDWVASSASITIASPHSRNTTATINGAGSIMANFGPTVDILSKSKSLSVAPGKFASTTLTIKGISQPVSITVAGLPKGVSISLSAGGLTDTPSGVTDKLTITAASSTTKGSYVITVTATGSDGLSSKVNITVKIS